MSFSSDIPLTYSQYSIQNREDDDNDLIDHEREIKPTPNFKVIPPIEPLGNLYTNLYLNYNKQESIDVFNTSTDVISTTNFNPETKDKQQVVFETDNKNNYIVTTVGQLNFFKWFLENKIFDYAISNIKLIDFDMVSIFINRKK
jgi:hypothetical protein